ncbi:IS3 family transposase [Desulfopila sp. IMCC35008]|uniref:IS3 family transposase n=1 Tax=Desulfopila sp. IMCC35008 TaxID=2653858 RepID=UPI0013D88608
MIKEIHFLSEKHPRFGYRKIYDKLKEKGWSVGRERIRLIRKHEGLQVIKKGEEKAVTWKKHSSAELG